MRYKPYGMLTDQVPPCARASDYSNKHHECVELRQDPQHRCVVVMHSRTTAPMEWKVVYGFSQIYFENFKEALDFCNSHNMTLLTKAEDEHNG